MSKKLLGQLKTKISEKLKTKRTYFIEFTIEWAYIQKSAISTVTNFLKNNLDKLHDDTWINRVETIEKMRTFFSSSWLTSTPLMGVLHEELNLKDSIKLLPLYEGYADRTKVKQWGIYGIEFRYGVPDILLPRLILDFKEKNKPFWIVVNELNYHWYVIGVQKLDGKTKIIIMDSLRILGVTKKSKEIVDILWHLITKRPISREMIKYFSKFYLTLKMHIILKTLTPEFLNTAIIEGLKVDKYGSFFNRIESKLTAEMIKKGALLLKKLIKDNNEVTFKNHMFTISDDGRTSKVTPGNKIVGSIPLEEFKKLSFLDYAKRIVGMKYYKDQLPKNFDVNDLEKYFPEKKS